MLLPSGPTSAPVLRLHTSIQQHDKRYGLDLDRGWPEFVTHELMSDPHKKTLVTLIRISETKSCFCKNLSLQAIVRDNILKVKSYRGSPEKNN